MRMAGLDNKVFADRANRRESGRVGMGIGIF